MEHLIASTSPIPSSGEDWFDPLEDAIRFRIRAFIGAMVEEEAEATLGGCKGYLGSTPLLIPVHSRPPPALSRLVAYTTNPGAKKVGDCFQRDASR